MKISPLPKKEQDIFSHRIFSHRLGTSLRSSKVRSLVFCLLGTQRSRVDGSGQEVVQVMVGMVLGRGKIKIWPLSNIKGVGVQGAPWIDDKGKPKKKEITRKRKG